METPFRLLPFEILDGPDNMAADEVLLAGAAMGTAALRCYGWSPATLSLGYFQATASRLDDPRLASLPYVRRASGGQTLVHHFELTYALALPPGPPWHNRTPWPMRMHEILQAAFLSLGVKLNFAQSDQRDPGTILCFRQVTPGDLLCSGGKVVGSAQRKKAGALLQHGGILLAQCPHTPSLPGIRELAGISLNQEETRAAIVETFAKATGWKPAERDWTSQERENLEELAASKYGHPGWNARR